MNRVEIKKLKETLDGLPKTLPISFLYKIYKIKSILDFEYTFIKQSIDNLYSEEYKEYDKLRLDIITKYCKKDKDNNPILINNNYSFDDINIVSKEIDLLDKEYEEILTIQKQKNLELDIFFKEELDISFDKLSIEEFPDELIDKIDELISIIE